MSNKIPEIQKAIQVCIHYHFIIFNKKIRLLNIWPAPMMKTFKWTSFLPIPFGPKQMQPRNKKPCAYGQGLIRWQNSSMLKPKPFSEIIQKMQSIFNFIGYQLFKAKPKVYFTILGIVFIISFFIYKQFATQIIIFL